MQMFVTKKWIEINDLSGGQYSFNKNVRFKTYMIRSDLYNFSDAYIVVKGRVLKALIMLIEEIKR